jgi:TrmH family RNA methyltransferase
MESYAEHGRDPVRTDHRQADSVRDPIMLSRSERKQVRALGNRKDRAAAGLFLAEGIRVVEELLDASVPVHLSIISSALQDTPRGAALASRLAAAGPVRRVGVGQLNELADTRTNQGVLVMAESPEGSLDTVPDRGPSTLLLLDGVQDPGNVGTLLRAARAFGCHAAVCLPGTADPWNAKAVRASAGALFHMPVVRAEAGPTLDRLQDLHFALLGADARGAPVEALTLTGRTVLAVGNEGRGLGEPVLERADALASVPMEGGVESLNVALAAGILLYLVTRVRT